MQKILAAVIASAVVVVMLSAFGTLAALATPSPTGSPGQPGACTPGSNSGCTSTNGGTTCQPGGPAPGQSASTTTQSPFVPTGSQSLNHYANPGTQSQLSSGNPTATGQYDISCFQQSHTP